MVDRGKKNVWKVVQTDHYILEQLENGALTDEPSADGITRGSSTTLWIQAHSVHPELPDVTSLGWKLESKDLELLHFIS